MSELEKKIKKEIEHIRDTQGWGFDENDICFLSHNLAEIAEKERDLWYEDLAEKGNKAVSDLLKENTELKEQLEDRIKVIKLIRRDLGGEITILRTDLKRQRKWMLYHTKLWKEEKAELKQRITDIKYLDRDEVEKIIENIFVDRF